MPVQHARVHGRHAGHDGGPPARQQSRHVLGAEASGQRHACPGQQRREDLVVQRVGDAAASHAAAGRPASGRYAPARRAHCSSARDGSAARPGMAGAAGGESSSAGASGASAGAQAGSPSARRSAGSRRAAGSPDAAARVRGAVQHPGQSHRGDAARGFLIGRRGSSGHGQAPPPSRPGSRSVAPASAPSPRRQSPLAHARRPQRRGAGHALMQRRVVQRGVFGDRRATAPGPAGSNCARRRPPAWHRRCSYQCLQAIGAAWIRLCRAIAAPLRGARQRSGWSYSAQRHRRIAFELALGSSSRKARASAGVGGSVGAAGVELEAGALAHLGETRLRMP